MSKSPLRGMIDDYQQTWTSAEPAARRFLLAGFIFAVRSLMFTVAFPLFLKTRDFDAGQIGLLVAAVNLSLIVFGIPVSRLAARGQMKVAMTVGEVIAAIGCVLLIVAPSGNVPVSLVAAVLSGVPGAIFWILGDALLAQTVPAARRSHAYALKFAILTAGWALGGGLGGWVPSLLERMGLDTGASLAATLGVIAVLDAVLLLTYRSMPDVVIAPARPAAAEPPDEQAGPSRRGMALLILAVALPEIGMAIGHNAIRPFQSLFYSEVYGLTASVTGSIIAVLQLIGGIGALLLPAFAVRFGNARISATLRIVGGMALLPALAGLGLAPALAGFFVYYLVMDATEGTYIADAMGRTPPEQRTNLSAFLAVCWSLTGFVSASVSGYLQDWSGFTAAFLFGIVGYMISAGWLLVVTPRIPMVETKPLVIADPVPAA